jgi:hypothetical protein
MIVGVVAVDQVAMMTGARRGLPIEAVVVGMTEEMMMLLMMMMLK